LSLAGKLRWRGRSNTGILVAERKSEKRRKYVSADRKLTMMRGKTV
jgi:hypothetical protein